MNPSEMNNIIIYRSTENRPVSRFLSNYENRNTYVCYRNILRTFLRHVSNVVDFQSIESMDMVAVKYLESLNSISDAGGDICRSCEIMRKSGYSPETQGIHASIICAWLEDCGIMLNKHERRRIFRNIPPKGTGRQEAELTRKTLRQVYRSLGTEWTRTLLLVLISTGMRIGEAMNLTVDDISWNDVRTEIHIPASITKTRKSRIVYLTKEAETALKDYLSHSRRKSGPLFPYTVNTAERNLSRSIADTPLGKTASHPSLFHWHMTRKWFISRFSLYANRSVCEFIAGHEGYLSTSYHRFTRRQILAEFAKVEKALSLYPQKPDMPEDGFPDNTDGHSVDCQVSLSAVSAEELGSSAPLFFREPLIPMLEEKPPNLYGEIGVDGHIPANGGGFGFPSSEIRGFQDYEFRRKIPVWNDAESGDDLKYMGMEYGKTSDLRWIPGMNCVCRGVGRTADWKN